MGQKVKYSYLRMEPADNGVIISYDMQTKNGTGKYENTDYQSKKEVYDFEDDEDGNGLDNAFERFKELWKMCHTNPAPGMEIEKGSY